MIFISRVERDQRTQPHRDKQNDFLKTFDRWIDTFKGTENVVGFAIQIFGGSYDVVFVSQVEGKNVAEMRYFVSELQFVTIPVYRYRVFLSRRTPKAD